MRPCSLGHDGDKPVKCRVKRRKENAESMNHGGRKQAKANSQIDLAIEKVKALLGE